MSNSPPSLVSHAFESGQLPPREGVEVWRHGLLSTHTVWLDEQVPFHASGKAWKYGDFVLTGGAMSPQTLVRTRQEIRHDQIDHYGLFTVGSGSRVAVIDERESVLLPGDLQVFDFAQPETSISLGGTSTTLYLPRDLIDGIFPGFSTFHGIVLRDPRSRLLARHLTAMQRYLGDLQPGDVATLVELTMSIAIDTLQDELPSPSHAWREHAVQRQKVVAHIRSDLADPSLTVGSLLGRLPLSRSSLFRLFEADGGVERFIRTERLRAIRDRLISGTESRSIDELAVAYGFGSGWALTRSFREHFGCTPGSLRASPHHPLGTETVQSIHALVRS